MKLSLYPVFMIKNAFLRRTIIFALVLPILFVVAITVLPVAALIDLIIGICKIVFTAFTAVPVALYKELRYVFRLAVKRGWHGA